MKPVTQRSLLTSLNAQSVLNISIPMNFVVMKKLAAIAPLITCTLNVLSRKTKANCFVAIAMPGILLLSANL